MTSLSMMLLFSSLMLVVFVWRLRDDEGTVFEIFSSLLREKERNIHQRPVLLMMMMVSSLFTDVAGKHEVKRGRTKRDTCVTVRVSKN